MENLKINSAVIKVVRDDRSSLLAMGVYRLKYEKGTRVKAPEDSLGCMCFGVMEDAEEVVARIRTSLVLPPIS